MFSYIIYDNSFFQYKIMCYRSDLLFCDNCVSSRFIYSGHTSIATLTTIYVMAFLRVFFPLKLCMHFWILPFALHALPIAIVSI